MEYWSGVESNFVVENTLVLFIIRYNRTCVKVTNDLLVGLAYQIYNGNCLSVLSNIFWSGVLEWSGVKFWSGKCGLLYSSKYSRTYENIQRV